MAVSSPATCCSKATRLRKSNGCRVSAIIANCLVIRLSEPSANIRARAEKARKMQHARFQNSKLACNADMGPAEVRQFCELDEVGRSLLRSAEQQMQLSARTYHRLLKVGRTIADLAGSERIQTAHLAEAIQYRQRKV